MIAPMGRVGLIRVPGSLDAVLPVPMVQWLTMGGTLHGIVEGDSDIAGFLPELIEHHGPAASRSTASSGTIHSPRSFRRSRTRIPASASSRCSCFSL
jgi:hypothetical protein